MLVRARVAAALLFVAALLAAPAAHAKDEEPGAFSARPSEAAPQDKRGTFFRLHVERGTDRRQSIVIENLSKRSKQLLIDAVDGRTGTTSGSVYANRQDPLSKAGSWIKLPVKSLDLPAGRTMRIPFSLSIPSDAAPGDHLAGIAIQDRHRTHSGSRVAITQIIRVVVGVQIIVDGPTEKALSLGKVALQALPGTKVPSVVVHLENTGGELCKPTLDVTLAGSQQEQQFVTRKLDTVLPGDAIDFPLPWPNALKAGTYDVGVQAKGCGKTEAAQTSAELGTTLVGTPDDPEPAAPVVVKSASVPWLAVTGLVALAAVLSAASMAFVLRRRRPGT
ncbi:MAG: DUF916 domain-containing protein [Solirubrobacteraceae bacterium]|nr:DUF916 domain-containing protein [Solirubrobacteraceae bacterium]